MDNVPIFHFNIKLNPLESKTSIIPINKPINFLKEAKAELSKVAWSTREELIGATTVVIVITLILGVFIGIIDAALSKGLSLILK
jgi:preprotein translocase subunit SecE